MLEKLNACPLCGHDQLQHWIDCKDYATSLAIFSINQCQQCSFKFTNPRPTVSAIKKYYPTTHYPSHAYRTKNFMHKAYNFVRYFTIKQKIQLINRLSAKGNVLDVGCGTGHFLQACRKNGWQVFGVEPIAHARQQAQTRTGSRVAKNIFKINDAAPFHVITLFHVLEHMHDLQGSLKKLTGLLEHHGKLVVALPNHNAYEAHVYQAQWAAYDVPRHLYHFTKATFAYLAQQCALKIIKIIPLKWDAYYICLLSEKYRNPTISHYARAIRQAYRSNQWAKKNDNNYTGLIYLLQKA